MNSKCDLNLALRRLVKNHGVPLVKLAPKLDVSPQECLNWWSNETAEIPIGKIRSLIQSIGADEEDLVFNRIRPSTVETGILDFSDRLNPKYSENAFSYVLSSKHIIEFIALRYGTHLAHSILYKLGVHPGYFRNLSNRINISFFEDLLREYVLLGNSHREIHELSKCIFLTTEEDPQGKRLFTKCGSYVDALKTVHESTSSFDENFEYTFEIRSNRVRVITRPSEKLVESTKDCRYGSKELYHYRAHLFGNMVMLCGLPPIKMNVLKCLSQGDSASIYEGDYPSCSFLSGN